MSNKRARQIESIECEGDVGWTRIVLSSPMGLLIVAILAASGIAAINPSVPAAAETARMAAAPSAVQPSGSDAGRRSVTAAEMRAVLADPSVRNFKGLAEYAWDFTDPNGMAGFGPAYPTGDQAARQ